MERVFSYKSFKIFYTLKTKNFHLTAASREAGGKKWERQLEVEICRRLGHGSPNISCLVMQTHNHYQPPPTKYLQILSSNAIQCLIKY